MRANASETQRAKAVSDPGKTAECEVGNDEATMYGPWCVTHDREMYRCENAAMHERAEKAEALYAKANRAYGLAEMGRIHTEEERIRFLDERNALRAENEKLKAVVRAYLRSPNRGQEERLRVKARHALKKAECLGVR